jgi:radical SAM protein with 4Fe4S-binding SPASM domain
MYPPRNAKENDLMKITKIFLIVSKDCNLRCKYCFVDKEPVNMSYKTALDATEFIVKNAREYNDIPSINFFGGEPLLKWDDIIVPLTKHIRNTYGNKFDLSMTSNGLLLDESKLEFMKENNIGLLFSMDGDKITQDLNRPTTNGHSSFDILVKKIPLILKYYPNMTFRSTTDHDNVSEFFNNHKFAVENGFKSIFNIVNVFSSWTDNDKEELEKQIDLIGDYYVELIRQGKQIDFSPFQSMFAKSKQINKAIKNNEYRTFGKDILGFGRCGIGASRFASVGTDGALYSCQEMVENRETGHMFVIGDIYKGEDNKKRLEIINRYDPMKVVSSEGIQACKSCKLNNVCEGACLINNYFVNGDFNVMPSILCFYYQTLLNKAEKISKQLQRELNVFKRKQMI